MIIHQSKLDGNEKLSQKYIYFWKLVRWRLNKLFRFSLSKNDILTIKDVARFSRKTKNKTF